MHQFNFEKQWKEHKYSLNVPPSQKHGQRNPLAAVIVVKSFQKIYPPQYLNKEVVPRRMYSKVIIELKKLLIYYYDSGSREKENIQAVLLNRKWNSWHNSYIL